jgi:formylglycine-generating enzyme required for sulfatase activity
MSIFEKRVKNLFVCCLFLLAGAMQARADYFSDIEMDDNEIGLKQIEADIEGLKKKAEEGDSEAQFWMGIAYLLGKGGLTQNAQDAYRFLSASAKQGNDKAALVLGNLYMMGRYGFQRNPMLTIQWLKPLAERGNAVAQNRLAKVLSWSNVRNDIMYAYAWYSIAAANGHTDSVALRDHIARELTPQEQLTAQGWAKKEQERQKAQKKAKDASQSNVHLGGCPEPASGTAATGGWDGGGQRVMPSVSVPILQPQSVLRKLSLPDGVKLELIACPAGTFMMGSPTRENGRSRDESQHKVTLTKPFWTGKTEVTQLQWQAVMGNNPSIFKGSERPVENVSWNDAMMFCKKLTEQTRVAAILPVGYEYRLLTEAEWEYACRAGTTVPYAGTGRLDDIGWYGDVKGQTHPTAKKQPNAWDLYDMHGNVWEWCYDSDGGYSAGGASDPVAVNGSTKRIMRGGSWFDTPETCRSAKRHRCEMTPPAGYNVGFRVALAPLIQ